MPREAETGHSPLAADKAWGQIQAQRRSQQDLAACMSWPSGYRLMVLGDGMGGYAVGEIASGTVIENFRNAFVSGSELNPRERLFQALQASNYAIFDQSVVGPTLRGMGTTLLAAVVAADALHWVSVGDSPLLEFRLCRAIWRTLFLTQGGSVSHAHSWVNREAPPACDTYLPA